MQCLHVASAEDWSVIAAMIDLIEYVVIAMLKDNIKKIIFFFF